MVWAGISGTSETPLIFLEIGVKMNKTAYIEILENSVLLWAITTHSNKNWIFQQDSAQSHTLRNLRKSGNFKIFHLSPLQNNGLPIHQI